MTTFGCGQCGAALAFEGLRAQTCPYCASGNFVERAATAGVRDPQFVVTFVGDAKVARRAIDRWLGSRSWFADPAIRRATVEELRGIYVPAYVYSAVAHTSYSAHIGENYTETETYKTADSDGKSRTATRTVTRTEYFSLSGTHVGYVTDVVVSASAALTNAELARIEPFDLRQMRRYQPALVSGWLAEEFARPVTECQKSSREDALDQIAGKLKRFMPGDSYSDLAYRTAVTWEAMDPVLVPTWVLALRYRPNKPPLRVVINGQTGKIAVKVPLSAWKIAIAVAVAAAAIVGLVLALRGHV